MAYSFLDIARTPSVKAAQTANGVAPFWDNFKGHRDFTRFTEDERQFIAARDSFYMATVSESGWPYVQHRGGPRGFLRVLDDKTLGFADFRGNLQYISVGNLGADNRASLILVDYPNSSRLKIFAHIEVKKLADDPDLAAKLAVPGYKAVPERAMLLHLDAFDWNCPQHITARFTIPELEGALAPIRDRIQQLEAENQALREKLGAQSVSQRGLARAGRLCRYGEDDMTDDHDSDEPKRDEPMGEKRATWQRPHWRKIPVADAKTDFDGLTDAAVMS